jgi:hypothetical protein
MALREIDRCRSIGHVAQLWFQAAVAEGVQNLAKHSKLVESERSISVVGGGEVRENPFHVHA